MNKDLILIYNDDFVWMLDAENVLFALGYRFDIEKIDGDEPVFNY